MLPLFALVLSAAAPQPCPATSMPLPAGLSGWRDAAPGANVGKAFVVRGRDAAGVRGLSPGDLARGGAAALVPIQIDRGGIYHIALGSPGWIDVTAGPSTLESVAHSHGPACSGIAKIVDFNLQRGRYALHLSGMKAPSVRVLIAQD